MLIVRMLIIIAYPWSLEPQKVFTLALSIITKYFLKQWLDCFNFPFFFFFKTKFNSPFLKICHQKNTCNSRIQSLNYLFTGSQWLLLKKSNSKILYCIYLHFSNSMTSGLAPHKRRLLFNFRMWASILIFLNMLLAY